MLQPKRTKYRRPQKGRCKGNAQRGNQLAFGSFGIKSLDTHWLTGRQIEAARVAMTRYMQREGQSWIRIFPDKPITKKPADVRMGKGKGDPVGYVFPITPGRIIFEIEGVSFEIAKEALRLAAQKLPVTTKFVRFLQPNSLSVLTTRLQSTTRCCSTTAFLLWKILHR